MVQASGGHAGGRWRAATLAIWLGAPGLAAAAAPAAASTHSRFAEGQEHFNQKRYVEAAQVFTDLLAQVDEELLNRVNREALMRNALLSYEWAYRTSKDDQGDKDVALLDEGQRVLDQYRGQLVQSYGADAKPSAELAELITRFEDARRIAHEARGPKPSEEGPTSADDGADIGPCLSIMPAPPAAHAKGCGGGGEGGDGSVAWLGMLALPIVRRRQQALDRVAGRLPADVVQRMRDRDDEG